MAASKSIILLNGIAGFAATSLASLGVFEVGYKLKTTSVLSSGQNNPVYVEDEPQDYAERVDNLGIPDGCDTSCDLTAEQLRNLKFEQRSDSSAAYDGLTNGDTFELKIEEVSGDGENYPRGKKYTLKAKETEGTVTIRNLKGDEIVLGGDEGVEIREKGSGGWLEKVPEKVNGLGIPTRCTAEDSTPQTCELTKEQLLRLKFEPKEENSSISIKGLTGDDKVTLTIETSSDSTNYPQGKKYTLTSTTGTVTIKGTKDGDIVLENGKGIDFREKSGSHLETVENSLGIPKSCSKTCELTKEKLERLKFEPKTGSQITVEGLNDDTVELKVETVTDPTNYPHGKKYTLKTKTTATETVTIKGTKDGEIVLEANGENGVAIRETNKGGKLEKTPEEVDALGIPKRCNENSGLSLQTCELTKEQLLRLKFEQKGNKEIRVDGPEEGNIVTLNVENKPDDKINYPKGKKYTLKATNGQVTIWNVKEGDITITTTQVVLIRETSKGGKLERVPEEVDGLGIPWGCKAGSPCQLTGEQLQRLTFETKNSGGTSVSGLGSNFTVELKVAEDIGDSANYPKGKKYTLTSKSGTVRIRGVKDGDIDINAQQEVLIREKRDGGLLEKVPEEVDGLGIPRRCITSTSCELTKEQLQRLKFDPKDNSQIWVTGLGKNDRVELKVKTANDITNYPRNRKYSFVAKKEGVIIKNTKDGDIVLEKDKEVLIREAGGGGEKLETMGDSLGIPKSCKANQVRKNNPQTCELTSDHLKNIKFKKFDGKKGDAKVSGLYEGEKLKLTISWKEGGTYPGNIKYSFDNTERWNGEIKIYRVGHSGHAVKIESWKEYRFKNNGGQLEQVESKTKGEVKIEEANEILGKLGLLLEKLRLKTSDFNSLNSNQHHHKEAYLEKGDELKKIQFKELGGGADYVDGLKGQKIKVSLDWDNNTDKFPYNMKITFQNGNLESFYLKNKTKTKTVEIFKNAQNIFKVVNEQDKWYLVRSS